MPTRGIAFIVIGLLVFLGMVLFAGAQDNAEQITITTYYPSPYGVYKNLRLFPYTGFKAGDSCTAANKQGDMAYSTDDNKPLYCNGSNWTSMGGGNVATIGGESIMYLRRMQDAPAPCPANWTEIPVGSSLGYYVEKQSGQGYHEYGATANRCVPTSLVSINVRTCLNNKASCRVLYLRSTGALPNCPANWTTVTSGPPSYTEVFREFIVLNEQTCSEMPLQVKTCYRCE